MIVVDASVALKWVLPERDSNIAIQLRTQDLIAPAFWLIEAANTLWRMGATGLLSRDDAQLRMLDLMAAPVQLFPSESDVQDALDLALQLQHPVYDCFYLALAIREVTYVVTADTRFAKAVRTHGLWTANLKLLGEI